MKGEKSDENIEIKDYNLSKINTDNEIDFSLYNNENKSSSNNNSPNDKEEKMGLNYSLIIKNIMDDIKDNKNQRYYEDEFKINLLLMSSLNNIHIKILCLNNILRFNEKIEFMPLVKHILTKIWKYKNNSNIKLNIKSILNILTISSRLLYHEKNYFYSFFFLFKAKSIILKESNKNNFKKEYDEIVSFLKQVSEKITKILNNKLEYFANIDIKKLEEINQILDSILRENQLENSKNDNKKELSEKENEKNNEEEKIDNDIDDNNNIEDDNSYLFLINKQWVMGAKAFINYYKILTQESFLEDENIKAAFNENNVLNSFFKSESNKGETSTTYPGPINNFYLLKYKDSWEDINNEDENYFINNKSSEYFCIKEKNYNILKDVFDSTNDIKIHEKKISYFEVKVLILDKIFHETLSRKLLRLRTIKVKKNMKIKDFENKLVRCIYYEVQKMREIDDSDYAKFDQIDDLEEINTIIKNSNFSFFLINKENKNVLPEICLSYMCKLPSYSSCLIHQLSYSEDNDTINTLLSAYNKSNHYLIIEISEKHLDIFLKEIKPNKKSEYSCSICQKKFSEKEKYLCSKCNMSIYCSQHCANNCVDHKRLHKKLMLLLKDKYSLDIMNNKVLSLNAFSNEGRVGLFNLGNTCYINCALQSLSNTPDLNKYFVFDFYKNELNCKYLNFRNNIVENFADLLKKLWQENDQVVSPRNLVINFFELNPQFGPGLEQDSQEFLTALLSNLHEGLNRVYPKNENNPNKEKEKDKDNENSNNNIDIKTLYKKFVEEQNKKNDSIINDLFNGYFLSTTTCDDCGKKCINFESFNLLSLPIPKKHYSYNFKYFTENGAKYFPFAINENSTFLDLKDRALFYYENDIINKIKKYSSSYLYNILNRDDENNIYNYNITKIPKKMLYSYIDIVVLDKNKSIYDYNMSDKNKILQYLKIKEYDYYEIVLYEKNLISDDYINIYSQASYYNFDKKIFFIKTSEIINYSYPVLLTVNKDVCLENLQTILFKKFEQILKSSREIYYIERDKMKDKDNDKEIKKVEIVIPHSKTTSCCPFCGKNYEESELCQFSDLFKNNNTFSSLLNDNVELNNNTNFPIILAANSKYFEVKDNYNYKSNILYIGKDKDNKTDKEINLFDCIEKFSEEEILDNENKWHCERCDKLKKARKKIQIYKTPLYLIIQLKRFNYSNNMLYHLIERRKNDTQVIFPENLDLKEYVIGEGKDDAKYELYSYILHRENHYISACKNRGNWVLYDDDSLYNINFKQSRNTYLLFYKKK